MADVVFLGTPRFGVPVLEKLIEHHHVVGVVTQPDRPYGRGRKRLRVPPVKEIALAYDLVVLQPASLRRDKSTVQRLRELGADVFVIAAFGQILRPDVLEIPPHGCIGVHASLLPELRGAAPIAEAIRRGKQETGVTLMLTDKGMDTGDIIAQQSIPIASDDTTETLSDKLSRLGADLLVETLPAWLAGEIEPVPQDDDEATYASLIDRSEAAIDWTDPAIVIDRQVRAFTPWPGTYCHCEGKNFKILQAHVYESWRGDGEPGTVIETPDGIGVVTGDGLLILDKVQLAGKRAMAADVFARGRPDFVDSTLESPDTGEEA